MSEKESQSVVRAEPEPSLGIEQIQRMAVSVAKSGLFKHVVRTPDEAFTLMMIAHAEGIHPMAALGRYSIIQGRPAKSSAAMLADFKKRGGWWSWEKDGSDGEAVIVLSADHLPKPVLGRFSMADARRAGLVRPGGSYDKHPAAMLRARAVSTGMRMADPVCAELYTPEETENFEPNPRQTLLEPVNVSEEPSAEQESLPAAEEDSYDAQDLAEGKYDDDPNVFPPDESAEPEPPITDAQRRKMFAKAREFGVGESMIRALLLYYGWDSTKKVPQSRLTEILAFFEQGEGAIRAFLEKEAGA